MGFLARVVLNLLRSLFLFKRATEKTPIHAPKPYVDRIYLSSQESVFLFIADRTKARKSNDSRLIFCYQDTTHLIL